MWRKTSRTAPSRPIRYTEFSPVAGSDGFPGTGREAVQELSLQQDWSSGWGEVAIVEKVIGYKKIKFYTHENAGYGDVRLPEMQMHTTAFWMTVPESVCATVPEGRAAVIDGLRGAGVALETVATLALMCDPRDLGTTLGDGPAE